MIYEHLETMMRIGLTSPMPVDPRHRARRLEAIREIIGSNAVTSQAALVRLLTDRGFHVTQSSVSRDLRALPVDKVDGAYRLTPRGSVRVDGEVVRETVRDAVTGVAVAGRNLVVLHTVIGAASRVGSVIDGAAWPEIVGTVAGDDTLFVAVAGRRAGTGLKRRLEDLIASEKDHG